MEDWNLYILFGVGGGFFMFFSSCFCYYKRKDVIRRRAEKIYENERDQNFASALTQPTPRTSNEGGVSSSSSSNRTTNLSMTLEPLPEVAMTSTTTTTTVTMATIGATTTLTMVNDDQVQAIDQHNHHALVDRVNSDFETTKL